MMKVMQTRPVPEMQATGTKIDKSRMMGDYQVRFCERVRLKCRALLDPVNARRLHLLFQFHLNVLLCDGHVPCFHIH